MKKILSLTLILIFLATPLSAMAEGQDELPYQELIDEGWLYKEDWNVEGEWDIVQEKIMEVAYHPSLKQSDRIIAVLGSKNYARLYDITKRYTSSDYYLELYKPDTQEFWDRQAELGRVVATTLMTINGEDWQKSQYRDMILKATFKRWPMLNDPAYLKYILDPKYNGMTGKYIYFTDGVDLYLNSDIMNVRYELQETQKKLPLKVFSDGGHAMIPLRGVLEALGATVEYDHATRKITIKDKGHTIILKVGSDIAEVDGVTKKMPRPVYVKNGYSLIPLRFVSENLDHWVGFFPEDGNRIAIFRAKECPPLR